MQPIYCATGGNGPKKPPTEKPPGGTERSKPLKKPK